jgi:sugar phosphate isomerase/epimerase
VSQVAVNKTAQCKRCGDVRVAWVKSAKTGRYYLAPVVTYHGYTSDSGRHSSGGTYAITHRPHKCDPAEVAEFTEKVAGYAAARGVTVAEWWQGK